MTPQKPRRVVVKDPTRGLTNAARDYAKAFTEYHGASMLDKLDIVFMSRLGSAAESAKIAVLNAAVEYGLSEKQ